jgi:hypothetical protein
MSSALSQLVLHTQAENPNNHWADENINDDKQNIMPAKNTNAMDLTAMRVSIPTH